MTLAEELTRKWHSVLTLTVHIPTWTEPHCLAYCCEIASKSEVMVELGTYMGASAAVMLLANPKLHLWCVDTFAVFGTRRITELMLEPYIKDGRCELITGDSARAADMLQHMKLKIDAVWVDDGHATEDVIRDIRCFLPLIKHGGEIFGHDWDADNDVAQGVRACFSYPQITIPVPRLWSHRKP